MPQATLENISEASESVEDYLSSEQNAHDITCNYEDLDGKDDQSFMLD